MSGARGVRTVLTIFPLDPDATRLPRSSVSVGDENLACNAGESRFRWPDMLATLTMRESSPACGSGS